MEKIMVGATWSHCFYKCLYKGLNNWSHLNNALRISNGSSKEFQWALWKSSLNLVSAFFSSNNRPSKTMKNSFHSWNIQSFVIFPIFPTLSRFIRTNKGGMICHELASRN